MRLIDADELKSLYDDAEFANEKWHVPIRVILANIDDMPTVDPVTHGRWIEQEHGDWKFSKEFRCSECGKYRLVTTPAGWEWRYCPNCGAKMGGDAK